MVIYMQQNRTLFYGKVRSMLLCFVSLVLVQSDGMRSQRLDVTC